MFVVWRRRRLKLRDRNRVGRDAWHRGFIPEVVVAYAVVDRDVVLDPPVVADPESEFRVGCHPREVGLGIVDVEALSDRVEAGEIPRRRIERRRLGDQGPDVGRQRRECHLAAPEDPVVVPHARVQVFPAHLQVVGAPVHGQVVPGRHVVLRVPLGLPVHISERQAGKVVLGEELRQSAARTRTCIDSTRP